MVTAGSAWPRRLWSWIDDRSGLSALAYPVPAHANTLPYVLGGVSFVSFIVLFVTGTWLAQFYAPMPDQVRASMDYIRSEAPLGATVRGIHFWTANILVVTVVLHMLRVFATASFKRPRELNWLVGVALLALTIAFAFTGTVLKWDQEAFEALEHNNEAAALLGGAGVFFSESFTEAVPVLARLYPAHVSLLPLLAVILFVAHFFLVKRHGISPLPVEADAGIAPNGRVPPERLTSRYSRHVGLMLGIGGLIALVALVLAIVAPPELGPIPNPTMEVTKPPFYFFWLYAFEDRFGVNGILWAGLAFFGLLVLVPALDRSPLRSLRRRRIAAATGTLVLMALVVLSLIVFFAPAAKHLE